MSRRCSFLSFALTAFSSQQWFLASCSMVKKNDAAPAVAKQLVVEPGRPLLFRNAYGSGKVESTELLRRRVSIDGYEPQEFEVFARQEEFLGRWGCSNGAFRWCFGLGGPSPRIVYDESELRFKSKAEARAALNANRELGMDYVGGANGCVVGFAVVPQRDQLNVSVYRYMLNDRPFIDPSLKLGVW